MELKWKLMQAYQLFTQAVLIMAFRNVGHIARSSLHSCRPVTDRYCHWLLVRDRDHDCMSIMPRPPIWSYGSNRVLDSIAKLCCQVQPSAIV